MAMEANNESKAAMKAAFDGLPFPPVRFLGAQYERLNTGKAGIAKLTNLKTLLQEAACARQRLHVLLRKQGALTPEQQKDGTLGCKLSGTRLVASAISSATS